MAIFGKLKSIDVIVVKIIKKTLI